MDSCEDSFNVDNLDSVSPLPAFSTGIEPQCILQESTTESNKIEDNATFKSSTTSLDDVILSIFWGKGKLGSAAYYVESSEILLLNDIAETGPEYKTLIALFMQVNPTHVVIPASLPQELRSSIKNLVEFDINRSSECSGSFSAVKLHFLQDKEFKFSVCHHRVTLMKLSSFPPNASKAEKLIHLQSIIDLNSESLVISLGALLFFLDKSLTRLSLQKQCTPIVTIRHFHLNNFVYVSSETYKALQIFPSHYGKTSCGLRDNINLFKLFDDCHTAMGSKYLRQLMSLPISDVQVLKERQKIIRFLLALDNEPYVKTVKDNLKCIKNVTRILIRIKTAQATVQQWQSFYQTMYHAVLIAEISVAQSVNIELFQKMNECLSTDIYFIVNSIYETMDLKESENQGKFVVKPNVSEELDDLKEHHRNIPLVMSEVAKLELHNLPDCISSCSIIYIPEIGYLLAIPFWKTDLSEEELMVPSLEHKFNCNKTAYYKSARCKELDNILGDSQSTIIELETKIMLQLIQLIEAQFPLLQKLLCCIIQLDSLLSLSMAAYKFNLTEPELVEEKMIDIKNGRHLFIEQISSVTVTNDYLSSAEANLIKVLTGPCGSGKSVYCKQNLLIVYLAHIGSFVPAEQAKIGVIDAIYSKIHSTESAVLNLSSFMMDLKQLSLIAQSATSNSIIVFDDFGRGTTEIDGLLLLAAFTKNYLAKGFNCPHIIITTHFQKLKSAFLDAKQIKFQSMEYLVKEDELIYLHKLKDSFADSGHELQVSKSSKLPESIWRRSSEILEALQNQTAIQPVANVESKRKQRVQILKQILQMKKESDEDLKSIVCLLETCPRDYL